ncbi:MAG: hypothetical protein WC895_01900 [Candidatus Shapirobacteria bacterium]|jgi:hypothetical protein
MKEFFSNSENKFEKGISIFECVNKAQEYIKDNDACLFLFDIKGSKKYKNRQQLQIKLKDLISDMNIEFDQYFPKNNLATGTREEKGFYGLFGDGSWVGINNSEVIPKIVEFMNEKLPNVSFHFNVAKDGYDKEALKTVK